MVLVLYVCTSIGCLFSSVRGERERESKGNQLGEAVGYLCRMSGGSNWILFSGQDT